MRISGVTVGYIKLNFGSAQKEQEDENALELERIYLLPTQQGNGAGSLLLNAIFEIAKNRKAKYIWLGVWEHNSGAIRFYERHNFVKFGAHNFMLGSDLQTDLLMKRMM